ncbi:MAG TPA: hypothetical protein ENK18_05775 [Deltaproteobacteria bacterium]|nr:hypothetical protein [Deltaproteobacteria bacterium]
MRTLGLILPLSVLGACGGSNSFSFSGITVYEMFPFDGDRTWEYISTDVDIPYKLIGKTVGEPDVIDGKNVYTVEYTIECISDDPSCGDGEVLRRVKWSSTSRDGVHIHGFDSEGVVVDFDPPLQVATSSMARDDVASTSTAGATWSSTMMGIETCPVRFTEDWDQCGAFLIETDAAVGGYPVAGRYWAVAGHNLAAIELDGDTGRWELSDSDCEGDCDGRW